MLYISTLALLFTFCLKARPFLGLFLAHLSYKSSNWDLEMVVVKESRSLIGGDRQLRFECTCNECMDLFLTRIPSQNSGYSLNKVEIQEVVKKKKTLCLRKVKGRGGRKNYKASVWIQSVFTFLSENGLNLIGKSIIIFKERMRRLNWKGPRGQCYKRNLSLN